MYIVHIYYQFIVGMLNSSATLFVIYMYRYMTLVYDTCTNDVETPKFYTCYMLKASSWESWCGTMVKQRNTQV